MYLIPGMSVFWFPCTTTPCRKSCSNAIAMLSVSPAFDRPLRSRVMSVSGLSRQPALTAPTLSAVTRQCIAPPLRLSPPVKTVTPRVLVLSSPSTTTFLWHRLSQPVPDNVMFLPVHVDRRTKSSSAFTAKPSLRPSRRLLTTPAMLIVKIAVF